jgi:cysteine synthase
MVSIISEREELYKKLNASVGRTPVHKIQNVHVSNGNSVYAKEEWTNPTGSVFDRIYPYLFRITEEKGLIVSGVTPVIEASTGNAGAAFSWCARELGYDDCTVITHEDTPKARVQQIIDYGAKVIFSPAGQYAHGYVTLLEDILKEDKKLKRGKIGENPHRLYCVTKIVPEAKIPLRELADETVNQIGNIDYFISVVGSGTTISGIGERLKEINSDTKVIALEHESTDVLRYLRRGEVFNARGLPHDLYASAPFGLGPEKLDINFDVIDDIVKITDYDWVTGMDLLNKREGKLVGRSSGASMSAALKLAKNECGKNFLIMFFDPAWKYTENYPGIK